MVSGICSPARWATSFNATLMRQMAFWYCVRSPEHGLVIIGKRYWVAVFSPYLAMILSIHFSHLTVSCYPVFLLRYVMIPQVWFLQISHINEWHTTSIKRKKEHIPYSVYNVMDYFPESKVTVGFFVSGSFYKKNQKLWMNWIIGLDNTSGEPKNCSALRKNWNTEGRDA